MAAKRCAKCFAINLAPAPALKAPSEAHTHTRTHLELKTSEAERHGRQHSGGEADEAEAGDSDRETLRRGASSKTPRRCPTAATTRLYCGVANWVYCTLQRALIATVCVCVSWTGQSFAYDGDDDDHHGMSMKMHPSLTMSTAALIVCRAAQTL